MNWKQIDRESRIQNEGVYSEWKQQISNDCYNQCVYCSIHEMPWGGIDHYHIDHFRPQSKFEDLVNIITNLYHCCPICNKFKSNDWKNEPNDLDRICYPDPSDYNYTDLFNLDTSLVCTSHKSFAGGAPGKAKVVLPSGKIPIAASIEVGRCL